LGDRDIVLVDTPGYDSGDLTPDKNPLRDIFDWFLTIDKATVDGILDFHRISDPRTPRTILDQLPTLKQLCGEHCLDKVVLVTTMWDVVESEAVGLSREAELAGYWRQMTAMKSQVKRFKHTPASALQVLEPIIQPRRETPHISKFKFFL